MNTKPHCPSANLRMLGDYWTLSVIQALQSGEKRFCEVERTLTGINPTTLTNRLKKLEKSLMIKRREETVDKLSVTYSLTEKGRAVLPVIREMALFASKFA